MATITNNWIGYLDRSYQQIKTSLLSRLTTSNPELTDRSESNPLVIFISMFAGIAEMLGYYIDNVAEESYPAVAKRRTSIIKHSKTLDYRIRARSPESVDIIITWGDSQNQPAPTTQEFSIGIGSTIQTSEGLVYRTLADHAVPVGTEFSQVAFSQVTNVSSIQLGNTNSTKNQKFSLGNNYVDGSLSLVIDNENYSLVETFANSGPTDLHFIVDIDVDDLAYLILGDGINGKLPANNKIVYATYKTTQGPAGGVKAGDLDTNLTIINLPAAHTASGTNPLNSSGGSYYEATEDIRKNMIRSLRTLDRMVTRQDHIDIIEMVPGVSKAAVNLCCGKAFDIYIAPDTGGIAQSSLINATQAVANAKKMLATFPTVRPAGETRLVIGANVYAKRRKSLSETEEQVTDALVDFGLVANQEINGSVRLSDLQALIDNQTNVDYVDITALYTIPYARPVDHSNILVWTNKTNPQSTSKVNWKVQYTSATNAMMVFRENIYLVNVALNTTFLSEDGSFEFTPLAGSYTDGNEWEFTVQPYNSNLFFTDFTVPTILEGDIYLTVQPTTSNVEDVC